MPTHWEQALSSLCQFPEGTIKITEEREDIIITATDPAALNKIQKTLNLSPESMRSQAAYVLTQERDNQPAATEPVLHTPPAAAHFASGQDFFDRIFDQAVRKELGGNFQWKENNDNQVAYFICSSREVPLKEAQLESYRNTLSAATFDELRNAIAANHPSALKKAFPTVEEIAAGVLRKKIVEQIFSIQTKNGSTIFTLNYGLCLECLVPQTELLPQNNDSLRLSKKKLLSFLGTSVFPEQLLFAPSTNPSRAQALCWPGADVLQPVEQEFILVLDCSGSMSNCFTQYREHILRFLENISQKLPAAQFTFIPFSDGVDEDKIKSFSANQITAIKTYLNTLTADGGTCLYGALLEGLKHAISKAGKDCVMLICTDGVDNKSIEADKKSFATKATELKSTKNPLKIYPMAIGEQCDTNTLQLLAQLTGTEYISAKTINDFQAVEEHTGNMLLRRELRQLIVDATQYTVLAYENTITAGPEAAVGQKLSVDGTDFVLTAGTPLTEEQANNFNETQAAHDEIDNSWLHYIRTSRPAQLLNYVSNILRPMTTQPIASTKETQEQEQEHDDLNKSCVIS